MNKIFKVVWCHTRGAWVAVNEHAASRGKSGGKLLVGAVVSLVPLTLPAADLPQGGQITLGTGSISTPTTGQMVIQQDTGKMAIDWQSFDIGTGNSVTFNQLNSSSIALNRVLGSDPSSILGTLNANGRVFLINPNGILFGSGASVNVGGLVASTLALSNDDFSAGQYRFTGNGKPAAILNQGTITADGGAVALLGGQVTNQGIIQAQLGTVALAAGNGITLDFAGDGLLNVQVDEAAADALVNNGSLLKADGGTVLMTARASNALLKTVVNNDGIIEAKTLSSQNGQIVLQGGSDQGIVQVAGTLDTSGGGSIETSGAKVQIADGTQVGSLDGASTSTWLIEAKELSVGSGATATISGATLADNLARNDIELRTTATGGDIDIDEAVGWTTSTHLTLTAQDAINVNADITATGDNAGLTLSSGSGYQLNSSARITLSGANPSLSIDGSTYQVINDLTTLQNMQNDLSGHYALGSDLVADFSVNFNPVGSSDTPFTGVFDGLGHSISNLTILRPATDYVGLFGYTLDAQLRQVTLQGSYTLGHNYVGSLVGYMGGNSSLTNSQVTGAVAGTNFVGGLVGSNDGGLVAHSYSIGGVLGANAVGGLAGSNSGQLIGTLALAQVSATGSGAGGLVGENTGLIAGSFSSGTVSGGDNVGGLVGSNIGGAIAGAYSTAQVTGNNNVGGLVGYNQNGLIAGAGYGYETLSLPSSADLDALIQLALTQLTELRTNADSISLSALVNSNLTLGGTFLTDYGNIDTLGDLLSLIDNRLASSGYTLDSLASQLTSLTSTFDLTAALENLVSGSVSGTNNVGGLVGLNDGGLLAGTIAFGSVNADSNVGGLIGLNQSGLVVGSHSAASVTGASNIGGLIGQNDGLVLGDTASGDVSGTDENSGGLVGLNNGSIQGSYALGDVAGVQRVGGLVGLNQGRVSTTYASGNVSSQDGDAAGGLIGANAGSLDTSFATGDVGGTAQNSGGLTGTNSGSILNSYATGGVSGGTEQGGGLVGYNAGSITNTYATGSVSVTGLAGGLLGYNAGQVTSSYWNSSTAGVPDGIGGGDGNGITALTSTQMKQMASFSDWSIADSGGSNAVWRIYEGQTTPLLRAFLTPLTVTTEDASKTYDGVVWAGGSAYTTGSVWPTFWNRSLKVDDSLILGSVNTSEPARNAGTYALDSGLYSTQLGYDISYIPGTLTINKAPLVISASSDQKIYDGTTTSLGEVSVNGLVAGDTADASQSFDASGVGPRTLYIDKLKIDDGNGGNNYQVTTETAEGTIDPNVRLSPAYQAVRVSNDPCRSASRQWNISQRSDCPVTDPLARRQDNAPLYDVEDGGMRLPKES